MGWTRSVLAAGLCGVLAACALQSMPSQKAAQYKRVGVLSAMGDEFFDDTVGGYWGNEAKLLKLAGLDADTMITEEVTRALAARYAVVDLSRYRDAFIHRPKYWPSTKPIVGGDRPMANEVVRDLMGREGLDAYVIVTPGFAQVKNTSTAVAGIGVARLSGGLFFDPTYVLHDVYIVAVVDGKDFSLVADMRAAPTNGTILFNFTDPFVAPFTPIAKEVWQAPTTHVAEIKAALSQLLAANVPQTLQSANLLPKDASSPTGPATAAAPQ